MFRVVALISGSGRTLLNLLDRQAAGTLRASIVGVISSKPAGDSNAAVFARCEADDVPVTVLRPATFVDPAAFSAAQAACIDAHHADLVCMAGYLKFWPIPESFRWRVINIHPALLPKFGGKGFYGRRVHEAVLAAGATGSGCTVHYVDNEYDHGPIILQRHVPVQPDDTPDTLAARVFAEELEAYPAAINLIADGRVTIDDSGAVHVAGLANP